ncbi:unnamed protein product [Hydatigera taeniaeformis]|uniref:Secreted protein n=1 Tax=Hydatigena taeniaeformis TaxID=6205 RepID=A0A0R3WPK8_HYDTA|nr:unnamed protein product [Hydatigera taeniaeformis]
MLGSVLVLLSGSGNHHHAKQLEQRGKRLRRWKENPRHVDANESLPHARIGKGGGGDVRGAFKATHKATQETVDLTDTEVLASFPSVMLQSPPPSAVRLER